VPNGAFVEETRFSNLANSDSSFQLEGGPKIISFNITTATPIRTYIYSVSQYNVKLQLNDIKINTTLGYAFITEDSSYGSITTLDLNSGTFIRHLFNTTYTKPDPFFTSMYNGEPIRNWNDTTPSFMSSGSVFPKNKNSAKMSNENSPTT
jgi:hypothetical protein